MNLNYLKDKHQNTILELLQKYEKMFYGTLDKYTASDYTIEIQENVKPYHTKPFPIPKIHKPTLNKEVDRLNKIEVLKKINNSQWAAPTLLYLKKWYSTSYKTIKRKPLPIPNNSRFIT